MTDVISRSILSEVESVINSFSAPGYVILCNLSAQIDVIAFLHSIHYQLTRLADRDFLDEVLATFWLIF